MIETKDSIFIQNIKKYIDENINSNLPNNAIIVEGHQEFYEIFYELNLELLSQRITDYYTIIDGTYVFFNNITKDFRILSKASSSNVLKVVFPEQYSYYNKNGTYPMLITFSGITWIFKEDELVDILEF